MMLLILLFMWEAKNFNCEELLDIAKEELSNLLHREAFLVRELFIGYEWNRISRSDRLLLSTLFLNYIKISDIGGVFR